MRLFPGFSSMTLGVTSIERATLFYEMLGWKRSPHSSRAVSAFELNNLLLFLRPTEALMRDLNEAAEVNEQGFCIRTQNYGDGHSVRATLEQAQAAGAKILRAASAENFGRRGSAEHGTRGMFADPDGHVWDLVHDPRLMPAPDGSVELMRKVTR